MNEIYGYGCVSSGFMPRRDPEALKKTKAYQALKNTFLSEDCIYIDIITAKYRTRAKLNKILKEAEIGDCIVITNISALGTTTEEIKENYLKIYNQGIGLLIPDYSQPINNNLDPLSTSDWKMMLVEELFMDEGQYPPKLLEKLAIIDNLEIKTHQGRAFKDRPEYFVDIYWLYENYFLSETDTYNNKRLKISKKLFYRLATEYETTDPNYYMALQEQDEMFGISEKPKRHGAVPEDFPQFLELLDQGLSLEEASKQMNYNIMNPIDFKRYQIKYLGGRKSMAVANELRKTDLAKDLTKDIINDESPID